MKVSGRSRRPLSPKHSPLAMEISHVRLNAWACKDLISPHWWKSTHCPPERSNNSNFISHRYAQERSTRFYPVLEYFTLKAYIDLYAFNAMKLKHKSYYIRIPSITYYMVWANAPVVLKSDDFHNYLILKQLLQILFFIGPVVSLVWKLLSFNIETWIYFHL